MSQWVAYNEVAKLVGTGAVGSAQQGINVKLSEDGNFMFVGGYGDSTNIGFVSFILSFFCSPIYVLYL